MLSNGILVELTCFVILSYCIVFFFVFLKTNKQTNKHPQQNKSKARALLLIKLLGSLHVSERLPTYPSPKPTLTLSSPLRAKCWLGGGVDGKFPRNVYSSITKDKAKYFTHKKLSVRRFSTLTECNPF